MGTWLWSIHLKTSDARAVGAAATKVADQCGGSMAVSDSEAGWVSVYPQTDLIGASLNITRMMAEATGIEHILTLVLEDSDVFRYWYFRKGALADAFISCPDYYGKMDDDDLNARGNPQVFGELLDDAGQRRLGELVAQRMINGQIVVSGAERDDVDDDSNVIESEFDFEDVRMERVAEVFGIRGAGKRFEDFDPS